MPEWTICPECSLKHRQRPDGQCPRCRQPLAGGALSGSRFVRDGGGGDMAAAAALPDLYDGRAVPRSLLQREGAGDPEDSPWLGPAGVAIKRLFGVVVSLPLTGYVSSYVAQRLGFGAPELEVTDFSCARTTMSDIVLTGTVKNISKDPLSLTAKAALIFVVDRRPRRAEGPVTPEPLPPGDSGRFEIRTQLPAGVPPSGKLDDGRSTAAADCRLEAFTDKSTGNALSYSVPKTNTEIR